MKARDRSFIVSDEILSVASKYISGRCGHDFYSNNIRFVYARELDDSSWRLEYCVSIPPCPPILAHVILSPDSDNRKIIHMDGIPDCISDSLKCKIMISKDDAIKLAIDSRFKPGITPWKTNFIWDDKYDAFAWEIVSTLSEPSKEGYSWLVYFQRFIVNANTGEYRKPEIVEMYEDGYL